MEKALLTSNNKPMRDNQRTQLIRLGEDAVRKGLKAIKPTVSGAHRIHARGDELINAIISKMRELSRELPSLDCFGIADWLAFHGECPWDDALLNSPCPFNKGKTIRETHFSFVGLESVNGEPLTLLQLQKLYPQSGQPRFASYAPGSWYSQQRFATFPTLQLRYHLLLRDIVPDSENRPFDEQKAMLPEGYEVPSAVVETAKDLFVFQKTGRHVNPNRYARTSDLDSDGSRVLVGRCSADGVRVRGSWGDRPCVNVGVGASRKFNQVPRS